MPSPLNDLIAQLRQQHGTAWEGLVGLPVPGAQQGGVRTMQDAVGLSRAGAADLSLGNLGRMAGNMLSLSGTGAVTTGIGGLAHAAGLTGPPLASMEGHTPTLPGPMNKMLSSGAVTQQSLTNAARAAQRNSYNQARDQRAKKDAMRGSRESGGGRGFGGAVSGRSSRGKRGE